MGEICYPEDLPITARRAEILDLLRTHQVLVVAGETGSGKTTQLPKMCAEAGLSAHGRIGCTQPRRVAALSVSRRVAEELKVPWGKEVGCKIRFNDDTGPETRIKFMTDGILLAEIQSDPLLRAYSVLILDEAHERSLNIDFLLGYLRGLLGRRPDLKLVITSATIDTAEFSRAFGDAPVVEVSGRSWPVEIRYRPLEGEAAEGNDAVGHIEACLRVTEDVLLESDDGDVLVFLPTERDIREAREWMETGLGKGTEVLPLYGRMPAAEQQRIFSPGQRRRVILATNVAETSLTLPRIRFVVDAGLARVSRYNPRTRTKHLPVEVISQSSANQRAGRAGRLGPGVAIRLYAEEDYQKRPRFAQPELQRANLAEVILRMKAFGLGEIETFPFLTPPVAASIRAGYRLLHELGALDELNALTVLGRELARLPIDPVLGRMLLEARRERVLPEVLVITAGLSIPDPRERPDEQKDAAQAAHQKFAHPQSDFLSLLEIWRQSPSQEGRTGSNLLRRFCKAHFLSFTRMREWRDIHRQLEEVFPQENRLPSRDIQSPVPTASRDPEPVLRKEGARPGRDARESARGEEVYRGVHRAILSGLLGQIAQRQERNRYKASGNRILTLFPGSHLFARQAKPKKVRPADGENPEPEGNRVKKDGQPEWIMAAEVVETSQLFARTVAGIQPEWAVDLGAHLCEARHAEPYWSAKAGRVLVLERRLLHGLEISRRQVDYGRINPTHATELFIRGALVAADIPIPLRFFQENQRTRDKVETSLTRVRHNRALDLEEVLYRFYAARISGVSSLHDLNRLVAASSRSEPDFCLITEADLLGEVDAGFDRSLFPDQIQLGNAALPLSYCFDPGGEDDGVTLRVPLPVAEHLSSAQIQWLVPGLRQEQIQTLLRALPKTIRRMLMPLEVRAAEVAKEFDPGRGEFLPALADHLTRRYRIHIRASDWPAQQLPPHLCPRVEVLDHRARPIVAGRDVGAIQQQIAKLDHRTGAWRKAAEKWERNNLRGWSFGDLPETVFIEEMGGAPVLAHPGLEAHGQSVNVRLYRKPEEAGSASAAGVRRLVEMEIGRELANLGRELLNAARQSQIPKGAGRSGANPLEQLAKFGGPLPDGCAPEAFQTAALKRLLEHAFDWKPLHPLSAQRFRDFLDKGRRALPGLALQLVERTREVQRLRAALQAFSKRYKGMEADLDRVAPANVPEHTPFERLQHLPRYLKAIQIRAERAVLNPLKDAEKAAQLLPYLNWRARVAPHRTEAFRWLLEEFRVSLFAQELGTAEPVSSARLNALLEA
jgi:ATP-dependent helicase HrpA